ncbi:hypothetical protein EJB05_56361, partial [Eragrostis curvula]
MGANNQATLSCLTGSRFWKKGIDQLRIRRAALGTNKRERGFFSREGTAAHTTSQKKNEAPPGDSLHVMVGAPTTLWLV